MGRIKAFRKSSLHIHQVLDGGGVLNFNPVGTAVRLINYSIFSRIRECADGRSFTIYLDAVNPLEAKVVVSITAQIEGVNTQRSHRDSTALSYIELHDEQHRETFHSMLDTAGRLLVPVIIGIVHIGNGICRERQIGRFSLRVVSELLIDELTKGSIAGMRRVHNISLQGVSFLKEPAGLGNEHRVIRSSNVEVLHEVSQRGSTLELNLHVIEGNHIGIVSKRVPILETAALGCRQGDCTGGLLGREGSEGPVRVSGHINEHDGNTEGSSIVMQVLLIQDGKATLRTHEEVNSVSVGIRVIQVGIDGSVSIPFTEVLTELCINDAVIWMVGYEGSQSKVVCPVNHNIVIREGPVIHLEVVNLTVTQVGVYILIAILIVSATKVHIITQIGESGGKRPCGSNHTIHIHLDDVSQDLNQFSLAVLLHGGCPCAGNIHHVDGIVGELIHRLIVDVNVMSINGNTGGDFLSGCIKGTTEQNCPVIIRMIISLETNGDCELIDGLRIVREEVTQVIIVHLAVHSELPAFSLQCSTIGKPEERHAVGLVADDGEVILIDCSHAGSKAGSATTPYIISIEEAEFPGAGVEVQGSEAGNHVGFGRFPHGEEGITGIHKLHIVSLRSSELTGTDGYLDRSGDILNCPRLAGHGQSGNLLYTEASRSILNHKGSTYTDVIYKGHQRLHIGSELHKERAGEGNILRSILVSTHGTGCNQDVLGSQREVGSITVGEGRILNVGEGHKQPVYTNGLIGAGLDDIVEYWQGLGLWSGFHNADILLVFRYHLTILCGHYGQPVIVLGRITKVTNRVVDDKLLAPDFLKGRAVIINLHRYGTLQNVAGPELITIDGIGIICIRCSNLKPSLMVNQNTGDSVSRNVHHIVDIRKAAGCNLSGAHSYRNNPGFGEGHRKVIKPDFQTIRVHYNLTSGRQTIDKQGTCCLNNTSATT